MILIIYLKIMNPNIDYKIRRSKKRRNKYLYLHLNQINLEENIQSKHKLKHLSDILYLFKQFLAL